MTLGVVARIHWQALRLWPQARALLPQARPPAGTSSDPMNSPMHRPPCRARPPATARPSCRGAAPCCAAVSGCGTARSRAAARRQRAALRRTASAARGHARCTTGTCSRAALRRGDIGFAESYIAGDWNTPDLAAPADAAASPTATRSRRGLRHAGGARCSTALQAPAATATRARGSREEHPRPLRPGQRVLRAVAGPDDELFERPGSKATGAPLAEAQHAKVRRALGEAGVRAGRPRAGDRLRLGRAWPRWRRASSARTSPA